MESARIWAELLDGCKILAALAVDDPDQTKQAARVEARKAIRTHLTLLLGRSGIHFGEEAAKEIITTVARTFLPGRQEDGPPMAGPFVVVSDEMLGC